MTKAVPFSTYAGLGRGLLSAVGSLASKTGSI